MAAAAVYAGLVFVFAAWAMALLAVIRVRGVARSGIAPPVRLCCAPSLPAILGCAWTGLLVVLAGSGAAWALFPLAGPFISGLGPGVALLAFAIVALLRPTCPIMSLTLRTDDRTRRKSYHCQKCR
jgi:hypothetical protein